MDRPREYHTKSDRDIAYDITYNVYSKKRKRYMNGLIKSRPTDLENKLRFSKGKLEGGIY